MAQFRDPQTGVYYWESIDADSYTTRARIKIWDPREFAPWVLLWCLADYLTPKRKQPTLKMELKP